MVQVCSGLLPEVNKADMNALRFLLVHGDPHGAGRISSLLSAARHIVVAAPNLAEATEALYVERFDAVVLDAALPQAEVGEFAASLRRIEERQPRRILRSRSKTVSATSVCRSRSTRPR
jgi:DNA-binding response OmpR family regulator